MKAYKDVAGVFTIGAGTTVYPDGTKVKEGDEITVDEAKEYLTHDLQYTITQVDALTTNAIEQHQFDALVSFAYSEGVALYKSSTLRRIINAHCNNYKAIAAEFLKWKYADHHVEMPGILRRRKAEAMLYVYGELKLYFLSNDNII